ncbi:hypothetical protein H4W30_003199 [Amycolatopsis roodepoortensis]|uniref:Uncharacterized protein n=1 Tax=Amycolatopsis roodepoortensis TaxID=700274 RepID=A0ABR9L6Z8_9PSEU|nr:hypothetical protein [Amycolatopsis roodepoortensis]
MDDHAERRLVRLRLLRQRLLLTRFGGTGRA